MTTYTYIPTRPIKWPDGRKMFFPGGNLANKPQFLCFLSKPHNFIPDSNRLLRNPSAVRFLPLPNMPTKISRIKAKKDEPPARPKVFSTNICQSSPFQYRNSAFALPLPDASGRGPGGGVETKPPSPPRPNIAHHIRNRCPQPMTNCTSIPTRPIKWPDGRKMFFSGGNLANKPQFLRFVSMSPYQILTRITSTTSLRISNLVVHDMHSQQ